MIIDLLNDLSDNIPSLDTEDSHVNLFKDSVKILSNYNFLKNNIGFIIPTRFKGFNTATQNFVLRVPSYIYSDKPQFNPNNGINIIRSFILYYSLLRFFPSKESMTTFLNKNEYLKEIFLCKSTLLGNNLNVSCYNRNRNKKNFDIILSFKFNIKDINPLIEETFKSINGKINNIKYERNGKNIYKYEFNNKEDTIINYDEIANFLIANQTSNDNIQKIYSKINDISNKIIKDKTLSFQINHLNNNKDLQFFINLLINLSLFSKNSNLNNNYYVPSLFTASEGLHKNNENSGYGTLIFTLQSKLTFNQTNYLRLISNNIWSNIAIIELNESKRLTLAHARKAAIIQYMARNLSHNTGSHLIPEAITYFKNKLDSKNKLNDAELKEIEGKFEYYQKYTQERMELLAQLSSMKTNHNWTNYSLNEVIEEFNNSIIPQGLCDDLNKNQNSISISLIYNLKEICVSLPDGAIGKQALYVILENFIRNAYKHSIPNLINDQKNYPFNIKVSNPTGAKFSDYWCVDLYDELGESNKEKRIPKKLKEIKNLIKSSVLTKDGELREKGWGMLEMKGAAAFLIGYNLELLDEFDENFFNINYQKSTKNIGHRFYLRKPKLLIIDEDIKTKDQEKQKNILKSKGIIISNVEEGSIKNFSHQFIITNKKLIFSNHKILNQNNISITRDNTEIENELWGEYIKIKKYDNYKIIENKEEQNSNNTKNNVYYDSHGKELIFNNKSLEYLKESDIKQLNLLYYHPYKSRSGIGKLITNKEENRYRGLLLEAAFNKVLVIDERIQNAVGTNDNDQEKLTLKNIFSFIGVNIPDIDFSNFLEKPTEDNRTKILKLINNNNYIYVILHLTILEKLANTTDKKELEKYIKNTLNEEKNFDKKNRALVLVSGRGEPPNLPDDCFYLNYTTLYDCLIYRMSKPYLLQTLSSIRKR